MEKRGAKGAQVIELMANINAFVNERTGHPERNINEDFFASDTEEEVICRHDPSPLVTKQYLTGGFWAQFNFSFYAQSMSTITARQTLEAIEAVLHMDNFTELLGLNEGRLVEIARAAPVSRKDSGAVIYASSYQLVYFQEV